MRVSLCLDPGRSWPEVQTLAQRADLAGWHAVYLPDHFMPYDSDGVAPDGPVAECWSTLSALATQTQRIRLGSLVLGNTYRHPAVVANMAATLDRVSGGRVVLGIGAGWQPNEHDAYGIALPGVPERIDALDEACRVIRTLLDRRRSTMTGQRYSLHNAPCDPKPLQQRLPLLVGGGGEQRTLKVAARHADVWHTWADPALFTHKNVVLDRHCADVGRDPTDISRATGGTVTVWSARRHAHEGVESDVQGASDDVVAQLMEFRLAGADEFIVRDDATNIAVDRALAVIDQLSEAVIPRLGS